MSHESIIADLKAMIKAPLESNDPKDHVDHIKNESDRASIILSASMIEDAIRTKLKSVTDQHINKDETERLYNFEGPLGSFSNKIRIAQALGVFDRSTKKRIELIKEMRNVAAHSHQYVGFHSKALALSVIHLAEPDIKPEVEQLAPLGLRRFFEVYCAILTGAIVGASPVLDQKLALAYARI